MNLFLKSNSYSVITIEKFSNQLYIIIQFRKAISNRYIFQRLNSSRVVLRTNTCRIENSHYTLKKVIKINQSHEVYAISVVKISHEVYITSVS